MAKLILTLGQHIPSVSEPTASGEFIAPIKRDSLAFQQFVSNNNPDLFFKNEEGNGDDRLMTPRLKETLDAMAQLVKAEFPGLRLRVTEAWDDQREHSSRSLHFEGRAVDMTTSDRDANKLGRLAGLAVAAGFDWVFFENRLHVHASVKR